MEESMLTTTDNPFSPFDEFEAWFSYDIASGYHTLRYLARVVDTSEELSEFDQTQILNKAIDDIVSDNINGVYTKVSRKKPESTSLELV